MEIFFTEQLDHSSGFSHILKRGFYNILLLAHGEYLSIREAKGAYRLRFQDMSKVIKGTALPLDRSALKPITGKVKGIGVVKIWISKDANIETFFPACMHLKY